ncbi:hypothetical protein R3P38DRAFT_3193792 [Favolaschia claudopus]|uniref:Zn(2)-C6 fungal-type domain-containing protein n=1 Tax=Favolaschia claudopus TaxID=2862362 RepID=A0AAW0BE27_9AGAR
MYTPSADVSMPPLHLIRRSRPLPSPPKLSTSAILNEFAPPPPFPLPRSVKLVFDELFPPGFVFPALPSIFDDVLCIWTSGKDGPMIGTVSLQPLPMNDPDVLAMTEFRIVSNPRCAHCTQFDRTCRFQSAGASCPACVHYGHECSWTTPTFFLGVLTYQRNAYFKASRRALTIRLLERQLDAKWFDDEFSVAMTAFYRAAQGAIDLFHNNSKITRRLAKQSYEDVAASADVTSASRLLFSATADNYDPIVTKVLRARLFPLL